MIAGFRPAAGALAGVGMDALGGEALAVPLAALGAVLVASLGVGLYLSRAQAGGRVPARVRALAARGAAPAEIARRTGVSQDAVALMLRGAGSPGHAREAA